MKTFTILLAASLCMGTPVFAGKATKTGAGRVAIPIRKIDADGNHKIDGAEIAALKDAFAKAPADSKARKRLDTNGNGQLDDNEIAALNARLAKRAEARHAEKGAGKKKGKAA